MTYGVLVGVNLFDFGDCSKKLCFFDIKRTFQFGQLSPLRHCQSLVLSIFWSHSKRLSYARILIFLFSDTSDLSQNIPGDQNLR